MTHKERRELIKGRMSAQSIIDIWYMRDLRYLLTRVTLAEALADAVEWSRREAKTNSQYYGDSVGRMEDALAAYRKEPNDDKS